MKRLQVFLAASLLFLPIASPAAHSQAPEINAFARNIWTNVNFLDESSRLAVRKSRSGQVREFARSEAAEQTAAANALAALLDSTESRDVAAAGRENGRAGSLMSMPFRAAATMSAGMADAIDGVQTGRSVAVDRDPAVTLKDIKVNSFNANLQRLGTLSGHNFDRFYRSCQTDALLQLSTLYASYIQAGGDSGIRALAVRELPKVNKRLAIIKGMR